jgi:hypothetical protein
MQELQVLGDAGVPHRIPARAWQILIAMSSNVLRALVLLEKGILSPCDVARNIHATEIVKRPR